MPRTVRIYRRERQWVVDSGGRARPEIHQMSSYLPLAVRQSIREHGCYSIEDALGRGINPQLLTAALSAWYTDHPNATGEVMVAEGVSELPDNTAYLALGDYIYRMVPVRQAGTSKAVRIMREKVRQEVEGLRVQLTALAQRESQQLIEQANARAMAIRAEAARERRAEESMLRFPQWCRGYVLKEDSNPTKYILISTAINITKIVHGSKQWPTKTDVPRTVHVDLWMPLSPVQERVHLANVPPDGKMLPHITASGSCVKIGEKIEPIEDYGRLLRFNVQIARAMGTINLASLLNPDIDHWMPEVVNMLPDGIKKWLETYRIMLAQSNTEALAALPPTDTLERQEETWSVR